jgi:hypothetical protein
VVRRGQVGDGAGEVADGEEGVDFEGAFGGVDVGDVGVPSGVAAGRDQDGGVGRADAGGSGEDGQLFRDASLVGRGELHSAGRMRIRYSSDVTPGSVKVSSRVPETAVPWISSGPLAGSASKAANGTSSCAVMA